MKQPQILVVGSLIMDQTGTAQRLPREGETVFGRTFTLAPGGKGANQAVQAARLGVDVSLFGKVGRDSSGDAMLEACRASGVDVSRVLRSDAPTGCSMILVEERPGQAAQNRILVFPGANQRIEPQELEVLDSLLDRVELVMLQLEIPMEINRLVAVRARERGVAVMLNPAPSAPLDRELMEAVTVLTPNEHEAEALSGVAIRRQGARVDLQSAAEAAHALQAQGARQVLITLGSAGALLITPERQYYSPCVPVEKVVDPTAAGDSFVAAYAVALCQGWQPERALAFANQTAALTVSAMGAMPSLPTLSQVEAALSGQR